MTNTTEHLYIDERSAHSARRHLIGEGVAVSLIAFDSTRNRYAFDTYSGDLCNAETGDGNRDDPTTYYCGHCRNHAGDCGNWWT